MAGSYEEAVKTASESIDDLLTELKGTQGKLGEAEHFKLAYSITSALVDREKVDPEDFRETVVDLNSKTAEDLDARATLLNINEDRADLNIGGPDAGDKLAHTTSGPINDGPSRFTESDDSRTVRENIINNLTS